MAEGTRTSNGVDDVLISLGKYGRWQIYQYVLFSVSFIPTAFQYASIVFIGYVPPFFCDDRSNRTSPHSHNYTNKLSLEKNRCDIWDSSINASRSCENNFLFELRQTSIVSEWDLICHKEYLVPLSQTILTVGLVLGNSALLPFADKYGRKRTLVVCHWIYLVLSMLLALSPNMSVFTVGRFLLGLLHPPIYSLACVSIMELFPEKQMTSASMFAKNFWAIGIMLMCPIAYLCRDVSWRYLQLALSMASLLVVLQTFFMSEPIRWLFAVNKKKEAIRLIRKAARINTVDYERKLQDVAENISNGCEIEIECQNADMKHPDERINFSDNDVLFTKGKSLCGTTTVEKGSETETANLTSSNRVTTIPSSINNYNDISWNSSFGEEIPSNAQELSEQGNSITPCTIDDDYAVDSATEKLCKGNYLHCKEIQKTDINNHIDNKNFRNSSNVVVEVDREFQHADNPTTEEKYSDNLKHEEEIEINAEPDVLLGSEQNCKDKLNEGNSKGIAILFRHRRLRMLTVSMSYIWTADCLIYFGLLLLSPSLAGGRFLNMFLNGAIEVPAYLLAIYTLQKFNRKTCILWFHVFTGGMLAAATIVTIATGPDILVTVLATFGKLGGSAVSSITFLYGSEVFPTNIRGRAVGFCNAMSYVGALLSPFSSYLAQFGLWIPTTVFVVLCASVCILLHFLPETRGKPLPQTLAG